MGVGLRIDGGYIHYTVYRCYDGGDVGGLITGSRF